MLENITHSSFHPQETAPRQDVEADSRRGEFERGHATKASVMVWAWNGIDERSLGAVNTHLPSFDAMSLQRASVKHHRATRRISQEMLKLTNTASALVHERAALLVQPNSLP